MGNSSSSDLTTVEAFALDDVGGYNDTDTEGLVHHSPPSSPLHTLSMQVAQAAVDRGVAPPDAPGGHAIHDDDDAVVLTSSSSYERGNCTHPAAAAASFIISLFIDIKSSSYFGATMLVLKLLPLSEPTE